MRVGKKLIRCMGLLMLIFLVSVFIKPTRAYADSIDPATHTSHGDQWQVLSADYFSGGETISEGYYYVDSDLNVSGTALIEGKVVICLNGHKITANNVTPFRMSSSNNTLEICDHAGTGEVYVEYDVFEKINLVDIQGSDNTFILDSGKLSIRYTVNNNIRHNQTAAIYFKGQNFNFFMNGGSICGNAGYTVYIEGEGASIDIKGGTITNEYQQGFAMHAVFFDKATISGGEFISQCRNIDTYGCNLIQISGGTFAGETNLNSSDNVEISGGDFATVYMDDVTNANISGGTFTGQTDIIRSENVEISGGVFAAVSFERGTNVNISGGKFTAENYTVYMDAVTNAHITGGEFTAVSNAVCMDVVTNANITGGEIIADKDSVFLFCVENVNINGGTITARNSLREDNIPVFPVKADSCEKIKIDGNTIIKAADNCPEIYIEDYSTLVLPTVLPKKPYKLFGDGDSLYPGCTLFKAGDANTENPVQLFKSRFPGKNITDYMQLSSDANTLVAIDDIYCVGPRTVVKQPTLDNPVMEVNEEGKTSYQWYCVTPETVELTSTNTTVINGEYNSETGTWLLKNDKAAFSIEQTHDYAEVVIDVKKIYPIDVPESSLRGSYHESYPMLMLQTSGAVSASLRGAELERKEYCTLKITEPGIYTIQVPAKSYLELFSKMQRRVDAKIYITYYDLDKPIVGQTSKKLTDFVKGQIACAATFDSGTIYEKHMFPPEFHEEYEPVALKGMLLSKPFNADRFTVNFETNGGSLVAAANVIIGQLLTKPDDPKFKGLSFAGWYKDEALKEAWDFEKDKVTSFITLYAKWEADESKTEANEISLLNGYRVTRTKQDVKVTWGKVKDADEYGVFVSFCGPDFKKNPTATVKANSKSLKKSFSKIGNKKVSNKKYNDKAVKAMVVAYKIAGNQKIEIARTQVGHVVSPSDKKYTNAKTLKVSKTKVTLKKGKSATINATVTKQNSKKKYIPSSHIAKLRYVSTNEKVAKVNSKGKITAGKVKGSAYIYVVTADGMNKKVKVTVK